MSHWTTGRAGAILNQAWFVTLARYGLPRTAALVHSHGFRVKRTAEGGASTEGITRPGGSKPEADP